MHLLMLGLIVLLLFGPKRLPEIGHSLGKGIRGLRESLGGEKDDEGVSKEPAQVSSTAEPTSPPAAATTAEKEAPVEGRT